MNDFTKKECSLHDNQRREGTLCRSMECTKCPPFRESKQGVSVGDQQAIENLASTLMMALGSLVALNANDDILKIVANTLKDQGVESQYIDSILAR